MVGAASTGGVNRNSLMRRGLAARFAQTVGFGWPRLARDSTSTQAESATESHARVVLPAFCDTSGAREALCSHIPRHLANPLRAQLQRPTTLDRPTTDWGGVSVEMNGRTRCLVRDRVSLHQ